MISWLAWTPAAICLCKEISGAQFAFVQSDEISVLVTDFADIGTEAWFDNCQNKIESVSASIATMAFNKQVTHMKAMRYISPEGLVERIAGTPKPAIFKKEPNATFDARAWTIPDYIEVENYFINRQKDAERNSVTLLAQAYASHKQLQGKSTAERHEIIHAAGDNWAKHPARFKHGAVVRKPAADEWRDDQSDNESRVGNWLMDEKTPVFTKDRAYLTALIPRHWMEK